MALLPILCYPDAALRKPSEPVTNFDSALQQLINDMFDTMYENHGGGLAAVQVGVHQQIFVTDPASKAEEKQPMVFINPEILVAEGAVTIEEGCLSIPDVWVPIERPEKITVRAFNEKGESFEQYAEGYLARCIQHEMDHFLGKLEIDYLSPLKRQRIEKKYYKLQKRRF